MLSAVSSAVYLRAEVASLEHGIVGNNHKQEAFEGPVATTAAGSASHLRASLLYWTEICLPLFYSGQVF